MLKCFKHTFLYSIFLYKKLSILIFNNKIFFLSKDFVIQNLYIFLIYPIKIFSYLKIFYFHAEFFHTKNISLFHQKKDMLYEIFLFITESDIWHWRTRDPISFNWFVIQVFFCLIRIKYTFTDSGFVLDCIIKLNRGNSNFF